MGDREKGTETTIIKGQFHTRETANYGGSGKSIAHSADDAKKGSQSQLAAAADRAKQKTKMPQQQEGESPAAYGDRLRRWRSGE